MARRRNQGIFVDLMDLAAMLPWWLAFVLAVATYLLLSGISLQPEPAIQGGRLGNAPQLVFGTAITALISILKYAIPVGFVIGGFISLFKQAGRKKLYDYTSKGEDRSVLDTMTWRQFEILVSEAFKRKGYSVQETAAGADGGVDLVISKEGETYLVQCKQWKTTKVGIAKIRELYGVVASQNATGGIFVASGVYTKDATAFAKANRIRLIDGNELHAMIRNEKQHESNSAVTILDDVKCPTCNSAMVVRVAKRGPKAGNKFWGCSQYPQCRGARDF